MSRKLKEKAEQLRELLADLDLKSSDQVELDISQCRIVVTVLPLTTPAEIYRKRVEQAIALSEKIAAMIRQRGGGEGLDAVEAIRTNRKERGQEIG